MSGRKLAQKGAGILFTFIDGRLVKAEIDLTHEYAMRGDGVVCGNIKKERRYGGNGCPYCSGQKVWAGYNDFASKYPSGEEEWDSVKNEGMLPSRWHVRATGKSGGSAEMVIAGRQWSVTGLPEKAVHIAAERGCWLVIMIWRQRILTLPQNGIMRVIMGNCRNTLRSAARKKSGGCVRQAIAGSLLSIIAHLETGAHIVVAGRL